MNLKHSGTARLLPVKEAASRLGLGKTTTERLVRSGQLDGRKIGRRTLVPEAAIETFIENLPRAGGAD